MAVNTVEIQLDRPRQLLFNHNALADLDMVFLRDFGKSVFQVFVGFEKAAAAIQDIGEDNVGAMMEHLPPEMISFAGMRIFMWAGLKHEDKTLSVERTGELMDKAAENGTDMNTIMAVILSAVMKSSVFSGKKEDAAQPVGKPATPPAVLSA